MIKITDKIIESSPVRVGQDFKLKIKVVNTFTFGELRQFKCSRLKQYKCEQLKGVLV